MKVYKGIRLSDHENQVEVIARLPQDNPGTYQLHHYVKHSPDGFEWGYGGSGPMELARCILMDLYGPDSPIIEDIYNEFCNHVVANLPPVGSVPGAWTLSQTEIQRVVKDIMHSRLGSKVNDLQDRLNSRVRVSPPEQLSNQIMRMASKVRAVECQQEGCLLFEQQWIVRPLVIHDARGLFQWPHPVCGDCGVEPTILEEYIDSEFGMYMVDAENKLYSSERESRGL